MNDNKVVPVIAEPALIADIRDYLAGCLETPHELEEQSSIDARTLIARIDSAPPSTYAKDSQIEIAAQAIYARWRDHPEFVEWITRGNSHKKDESRALARAALEAIAAKEVGK